MLNAGVDAAGAAAAEVLNAVLTICCGADLYTSTASWSVSHEAAAVCEEDRAIRSDRAVRGRERSADLAQE